MALAALTVAWCVTAALGSAATAGWRTCPRLRGALLARAEVQHTSCPTARKVWRHYGSSRMPALPRGWHCRTEPASGNTGNIVCRHAGGERIHFFERLAI